MSLSKQPVIVIVGPTAVGKTKTGIELAKKLNGEIISGDSVQVYKQMDIGSAKVTQEEMEGIPHHLLDLVDPDDEMSVARFQTLARTAIDEIAAKGKLPIIVGGTGLYIRAILYDYQFTVQAENKVLREELEQFAQAEGATALHDRLRQLDAKRADEIHPNNIQRVVRAIEVAMSGQTQVSGSEPSLYDSLLFVLHMEDREQLYDRIDQRVDLMIEQGLVAEVDRLVAAGYRDTKAMQAIGYKEIVPVLEGAPLEPAVEQLKRNTRRFAKRQLTWFRHQFDGNWIEMGRLSFEENFKIIYDRTVGFLKAVKSE
ncbi:tRNA dimethylallyltransferase [Exiguobacterium sp. PvP048]|uniref:tRNA dimethylallyltransferase n=1 Tax=Exiguobacterium sibiricum (strain DSM 17290 / CCUG 55495 / CIP 109462 / JCM 13490 / 255-15) TaxID=262543 RepID=MIAA_EXIS2|nr:tRNA (adenosine(37)-N6)-dimethylallyltransferase MiaA [Exiguobacterium sibiricum]B1YMH0.1 RecName: Full=tRNA dimethylallyltransferase; AltName: Full=Dimethylallyl diphosphate:tRNA dimethylallyltransferase; Short=DMAPP:tRNA dimethylallyltransferase; Short=DMATase; AltName: Full=Isopentenyl-diphosphate:tRNA isopentenyltransferase; Short=IPP transferase; Short=IPPT; Short=IPTase [Exiguobacterium sibiricum 255-15]ACB60557.1 tRNA delta(2)-isopentenylpyrophosphate transferase [Exiguobacterium sibiri